MPTKLNQIYKCNICGNIVEVVHTGAGELVCCNQPMQLMVENTVDAAKEKHVPTIQEGEDGILVKVGEVDHPMEEKHFIEWIEIIEENGKVHRKHLNQGDKPELEFFVDSKGLIARAYCNLHGLWRS
jgi:superoxide reductase